MLCGRDAFFVRNFLVDEGRAGRPRSQENLFFTGRRAENGKKSAETGELCRFLVKNGHFKRFLATFLVIQPFSGVGWKKSLTCRERIDLSIQSFIIDTEFNSLYQK